ncbi:TetR/AcrR family transcriptional regulator [Salinisphaera hydrothermalis]|uniref:TetR family transcriptional regulator n=1 Tax=Salinisphaera hydrothermalis (strain C41B8) TaxID=1304275 RepID=A0A084IPU0_SALHC|nr:TetR/AcrR family transcriptional regulator [Salinisphaera hydrothermalis]KEZ78724.1 TetR family transcriptional regulator [Salinisphaera hydrothermalis C41B8]
MTTTSRSARRARSAQRILEAAQAEFAEHGFDGATVRAIAKRAGVHASLVMQHYGTKANLFAVAVQLPWNDQNGATDHLLDVLNVRVRELPPETRALVRSMLTDPDSEASMRDFLNDRVANLSQSFEGADAELRALLAVSSILGLTITQHFLKLQAFEGVSEDRLVEAAHAWITTGHPGSGDEPDKTQE